MKNIEWQNTWLNRLKTIGIAGSERVALTLSQMVEAHFEIESTKAKLCALPEIPMMLQQTGSLDLLISVHMDLCGQISGRSVLVFPWESAERLDRRLWSQIDNPPRFLSEMSYTAIKELGNVVTSSYMMAIEDWIDISLMPSIPDFSVGLAKAVLDSLIFKYSNQEKFLVCLSTRFIERKLAIKGNILIFLLARSVQALLQSAGASETKQAYNYLPKPNYAEVAAETKAILLNQL